MQSKPRKVTSLDSLYLRGFIDGRNTVAPINHFWFGVIIGMIGLLFSLWIGGFLS